MWNVAEFQSTSLFSLRPANATTSGGKTLVSPTPYAIKMALLDVAARVYGKRSAESWFPVIRDLRVSIRLPRHLMVINTFVKILRPHKDGPKDLAGNGLLGVMGNTIAYREMVQYAESLFIALQPALVAKHSCPLPEMLAQISYLGKRGGFMQCVGVQQLEELSADYSLLTQDGSEPFWLNGLMQLMDDCGPKMTFDQADVFSGKTVKVNSLSGRVLTPVVLPYRLARSSRSYSLYERVK